jgi:hypothetical protein
MSIFKTECDSKCVTDADVVVRSEMEFSAAEVQKQRLPGLAITRHMDVVNTHPGAVRRKGKAGE